MPRVISTPAGVRNATSDSGAALIGIYFVTLIGWLSTATAATPVVIGLDHIPLAVDNLEKAAADFRSLGFALKPGRPHEDGIRNQHVKFPDGTEIELITASEARDSLGRISAASAERGWPRVRGSNAPSIDRVLERLSAAHVEFGHDTGAVTFPATSELHYLFTGSCNRTSTDRPENFAHPNGAESLIAVWLA